MNGKDKEEARSADAGKPLRWAEELARGDAERKPSTSAPALWRLPYDLQTKQTALEQQNQELSLARDEIKAELEDYTELYDFAPVGYCTLDRAGVIRKVNLTGASLLGEDRSRLIHRRLDQFVSAENKSTFNQMLTVIFDGQQKKALCEVDIHPQGLGDHLPVEIVAMVSATGDECLAVVIDISERRRMEAAILAANDLVELNRMRELSAELFTLNRQLTDELDEREQLEQTLFDSQTRLRNLSAHLQFVREEERKAVAREIHDELGQLLATVQLGVSLLGNEYPDNFPLVTKTIELGALIADGIKTVQRIAAELRPAMLDVLGLADALEWQSHEFRKQTGVDCEIEVLLMNNDVNSDVATALFRIFQESLTNVRRHSQATKVEAYLSEGRNSYRLRVYDNGRGITQEEILSPLSIGLVGIRERVFILGGRMKICGAPEQGSALLVRLPVSPREHLYAHH